MANTAVKQKVQVKGAKPRPRKHEIELTEEDIELLLLMLKEETAVWRVRMQATRSRRACSMRSALSSRPLATQEVHHDR